MPRRWCLPIQILLKCNNLESICYCLTLKLKFKMNLNRVLFLYYQELTHRVVQICKAFVLYDKLTKSLSANPKLGAASRTRRHDATIRHDSCFILRVFLSRFFYSNRASWYTLALHCKICSMMKFYLFVSEFICVVCDVPISNYYFSYLVNEDDKITKPVTFLSCESNDYVSDASKI